MELYYHIRSPPCQPVAFLIKHMGLEVTDKITSIYDPADFEVLKKVNPQHTIPTLVDGEFVLWDSHAILIYLAEKYALDDSLYPKDLAERSRVNQRLFFDSGVLQNASMAAAMLYVRKQPVPDEAMAKLKRALEVLEMYLTGSSYVAGEKLTIADFSIFVSVCTVGLMKYDLAAYPNIVRWFAKTGTHIPDLDAMRKKAEVELMELMASLSK